MVINAGRYYELPTEPTMAASAHRLAALRLAKRRGTVRWRDFARLGVPPSTISRLVEEGALAKIGRGVYQTREADFSEHQSLAEAAIRVPHGIIALVSALRLHGLTTQNPQRVWMVIDVKARAPAAAPARLKIIRASGTALKAGVETKTIDGAKVRLTNAAKTVADCFKYRRHVGIDVAIEALRDGLKRNAFTPDQFLAMARIDRVENFARPYLEALA
jgi:predicted transcriptional regulator of viral defense system